MQPINFDPLAYIDDEALGIDWSNDDKKPDIEADPEEKKGGKATFRAVNSEGEVLLKSLPKDDAKLRKVVEGKVCIIEGGSERVCKRLYDCGAKVIIRYATSWVGKLRDAAGLESKSMSSKDHHAEDAKILLALWGRYPEKAYVWNPDPRLLELKALATLFSSMQKTRKVLTGQAYAIESETIEARKKEFEKIEETLDKEFHRICSEFPFYTEYLREVPGMGARLCGKGIALAGGVPGFHRRFPKLKNFKSYNGMAPNKYGDAQNRRIKRLESQGLEPHLTEYANKKQAYWLGEVAPCFIKMIGGERVSTKGKKFIVPRCPYRDVYDAAQEVEYDKVWDKDYETKTLKIGKKVPNWLAEKRCKRKMMVAFIRDFYFKMCEYSRRLEEEQKKGNYWLDKDD